MRVLEFLEPLLQGRLLLDGKHRPPFHCTLPVVGHLAVQLVGRGSLAPFAVGVGDDPVPPRPRVDHHDRGIRQGAPAWGQRWRLPVAAGGRGRGAALAIEGRQHPTGAVPRARALLDLLREAQARTVLRSRRGDARVMLGARRRVGSVARRLGVGAGGREGAALVTRGFR